MHELAICRALVEQVESVVREHHAQRALAISVKIGPLAGVEAALLQAAYPIAAAGTAAAKAKLILETSRVRVCCLECGAESDVASNRLVCGVCGQWRTRVLTGEELVLMSVELEKETADHV